MPSQVPFRARIQGLKHDLLGDPTLTGGTYEEMATAASLPAGEEIEHRISGKQAKLEIIVYIFYRLCRSIALSTSSDEISNAR
ncbi:MULTISPECIES: hypothetical protein [unclassified Rhizobium]|uniref:hypothetical protein n=1 Tax=unclassified Rhizobium TaxID=2613769 RepID=UPI001C833AFE|nr:MULTISPECIES: hypothetical protein [unclassified Rhizobium]MBX5219752.1 hypothetical protein [Rhizobium sp. NLR8a]MBX5225241.1 hypothetical protein [Rhizobium sp. NLR9b]MBX5237828.1 hypothetical protein [Rhizobium sp. NLR22b]MBX5285913.1 hypothetical protein [Rhizobium sp. NLR10b]